MTGFPPTACCRWPQEDVALFGFTPAFDPRRSSVVQFWYFARSSLILSRTPAPVQELLPGREDQLVCQQPDRNDDQHDAYDLIHGVELAAVVQQMTQAETGQDRHIDFRRHQ